MTGCAWMVEVAVKVKVDGDDWEGGVSRNAFCQEVLEWQICW